MLKEVPKNKSFDRAEDLIGCDLMDRYRVEAIIGHGGMSVVYRGDDRRLKRPVAIKVFSKLFSADDSTSAVARDYFVQEAFALSRLNHPNTLRIYDFGAGEDELPYAPFQVSELMEGGTLGDFVQRRGPLDLHEAFHILEHVGGAVSEAHAHGIIHRDIKPSNILFGRAGKQRMVKLADFSVAVACRRALEASRSDDTIVTPPAFYSLGWSPPEQIRGEGIDVAADIYALGLVLAFSLTAKRIKRHHQPSDFFLSADELDQRMVDGLGEVDLPVEVLQVILTATRARPEQRHSSVEGFLKAYRRAIRLHENTVIKTRGEPRASEEPGPWIEASPVPPPRPSSAPASLAKATVVDDLEREEILAGRRRVRPLLAANMCATIEVPSREGTAPVRIKLTFQPSADQTTNLHIRGMNCFVRKPGLLPTSGISVSRDTEVEIVGSDRAPRARVRVLIAKPDHEHWLVEGPDFKLAIPFAEAAEVVALQFPRESELRLFYRH